MRETTTVRDRLLAQCLNVDKYNWLMVVGQMDIVFIYDHVMEPGKHIHNEERKVFVMS